MQILCTVDIRTRELYLEDVTIAAFDHLVNDVLFVIEPIDGFQLETSSIKIAAVGPLGEPHDYEIDPSTVTVDEETGNINFIWSIPVGVTAMPLTTFKISDTKTITFAVCAEIVSGDNLVKAWHSDDGTIKVKAHLEPESGGDEDPEEEATNAQKIAQLQTNVAVINTQVGALANGSPAPVATVAEMTDESAVYLYTGSETGYTAGNWYYWDGTAWTSGGTYGGAVTDTTLSISGRPADAKAAGDTIDALDTRVTTVEGNILELQDGGYVADQQKIAEKINDWLEEHPEATTTVQDGSLTIKKLVTGTLGFVTPEMFGAKGDGITDDTQAILAALKSEKNIVLLKNGAVYSVSNPILDGAHNVTVIGYGATIKVSVDFEFSACMHRCCLEIENSSNIKFEGITFDASWREIKTAFNLEVNTTLENYCVRLRGNVNGITFYKCIFGNQLKVCIQTQGSYLGGDRTNPANVNSNFIPNKNIDIGYCTFGWNYEAGLHNGAIQMLELPQVATDVNTKIHDNLMLISGVHGIHIYYGNNNVIIENNTVLNSGHCVLEEYYLGGGTIVRGYGIEVTSSNKITIKNNYVRNFIAGGIVIFDDCWYSSGDIHDIIIDGNIVEQEADYSTELTGSGILLNRANRGTVTQNICKNIYRTSNIGDDIYGVLIISSNHIEFSNNIISACENGAGFSTCRKVSFANNIVSALNKLQGNNVSVGVNFYSTNDISCIGNLFEKDDSDSTKFDGIQISTVENVVVNGNIINGLRYGIKDNSGANSNISIYGTIFKSVAYKYVWWGTYTDLVIDFVAVANNT